MTMTGCMPVHPSFYDGDCYRLQNMLCQEHYIFVNYYYLLWLANTVVL